MKKLIRNGVEGIFSDADWKSGQPQRYGWQEQGHEKKEIPKEIIQFIERRRPPEPELTADKAPEPIAEVEKPIKKVVKPKAKKNDNPKQKDRPTAKGKPGRVAKN